MSKGLSKLLTTKGEKEKREDEAKIVMGKYSPKGKSSKSSSTAREETGAKKPATKPAKPVNINFCAVADFLAFRSPSASDLVPLRIVGLGVQNINVSPSSHLGSFVNR